MQENISYTWLLWCDILKKFVFLATCASRMS